MSESGREHRHLGDEDLLQALLEPASESRRGIDRCAACSLRARELASFVAHLRGLLEQNATYGGESSARLAELVLARTTRLDPSWRGDLRLLTRFARERWRTSGATRVAAACLLINIVALPVLLWFAFDIGGGPSGSPQPRVSTLPREPDELHRARSVDAVAERAEAQELADQLRALEARNLRAAHAPLASAFAQPTDDVALLLWARAKQLESGSLDGVVITVGDSFEPIQVALSIEILLDSWALTGRRPPALREALAEFAAWSERIHDELALLAWERAESYGAVEAFDVPQLAAVRRALRGNDRANARGDGTPLDSAWFNALDAALAGRPHAAPGLIDAWLALRR